MLDHRDTVAPRPARALLALSLVFFAVGLPATSSLSHDTGAEYSGPGSPPPYWFPEAGYAGPLGHAPIGVTADHAHRKGEWMLSSRFMVMGMEHVADGTKRLSSAEVTAPSGAYDYLVAPTRMTTQMWMLGAMWAPLDRLTVMAMLPYLWKDMQHVVGQGPMAGRTFTTRSNGVGDFSLTGIVPVVRDKDRHYLVSLGIGFPTGSIDEKDNTPLTQMFGMPPAQLPYPMQLGSGSFELRPGVVLKHIAFTHFDFGARGSAKIRLDRNEHGYRLGEEYEVTAWAALLVSERLSASFRLAWQQRFDIHGSDDELMTRVPLGPLSGTKVVPTAFPENQGFRRLYGYWGINLKGEAEDGWLQGLRIAAEVGFPFWQSLDGPQLRDRIMATVGMQYSF